MSSRSPAGPLALGPLQLVEGGNSSQPVTSRHSRTAAAPDGGSMSTGPNRARSAAEYQRGHAPAAEAGHPVMVGPDLIVVVGSSMAWPTSSGSSPSRPLSSSATSRRCGLRPSTCSAVRPRDTSRPRGPDRSSATARRPASSTTRTTTPVPTGASSPGPVDLLQAEEPPAHVKPELIRTSRIHSDAWYAHGHMTSKWKSTASIGSAAGSAGTRLALSRLHRNVHARLARRDRQIIRSCIVRPAYAGERTNRQSWTCAPTATRTGDLPLRRGSVTSAQRLSDSAVSPSTCRNA